MDIMDMRQHMTRRRRAVTLTALLLLAAGLAACTGAGPKAEDQRWFECPYTCGGY